MALLSTGVPIPLGVSKSTAQEVLNAVNDMMSIYYISDGKGGTTFEWPKDGTDFPVWKLNLYRNALDKFENVFSAEMSETATYFVPRKGIYNTGCACR